MNKLIVLTLATMTGCVNHQQNTTPELNSTEHDRLEDFFWPPPGGSYHPRFNSPPFPWPPHEHLAPVQHKQFRNHPSQATVES